MSQTTARRDGHVPRVVSLINPVMERLMRAGMPAGPNVLLTVTGRRSGRPHTFPVALLETDGRIFVQSPYGEVDWVKNLRAARAAILARAGREEQVDADELSPETGGPILRAAMAPYLRGRLRARFARFFVPLGPEATLADHVEHVRRHPMFELRPRPTG